MRTFSPSRSVALLLALVYSAVVASSDQALTDIVDRHWAWTLENYPEMRAEYGDDSGNAQWTDISLEGFAQRQQALAAFAVELDAIEPATLSENARLNRLMLSREIRDELKAYDSGLHLMGINMRSGPQHRHAMAEWIPLDSAQDFEDWLSRLEKLPEQLQQHQRLLEAGIERDRVQARIVMARVPDQINRVVVSDSEQSPFYKAFVQLPDDIPAETATRLRQRAKSLIENQLNPAYSKFGEFIESTYLPATREQPGVGSLTGGKALYRERVAHYTTTELSPEAIHQIGLDEVARIREEMEQVIAEVGFQGDIAQFNNYLRTDPQFYYESPEALLEGYQAISKRIDPQLVKLFGQLPRMPYGVRPIPEEMAPDTTTAYYMGPAADGSRAGWYYVNLYKPEVRPKFEMEVLSVHESVPGHHLQIALAMELGQLPEFRKNSNVTAFVEGWGLYSERLGYDLGLYQDPYSRYGQLIYDMWRAVRLVVDTGIHYFGWSRERAIEFFKANAAKTETDIVNEIDRYIGWPGQALAYKIGQLTMLELRQEAERDLGAAFDIRAFHDHLLGAGALPLDALEARMRSWIREQQAPTSSKTAG